ncbi:hypothetical protein SBOR_4418 [Sclerotinia borealis F-4128]|uniref:Uncharacterized protein n=1 Tax=Sclerotinia borealis (strain F-4128) TaxID=1432307 RepID=W9CEJ5_SCLBF|nr:hypothetical protein SBOR_4418 [Sclerotinia borealis F-4128]
MGEIWQKTKELLSIQDKMLSYWQRRKEMVDDMSRVFMGSRSHEETSAKFAADVENLETVETVRALEFQEEIY